MNMAQVLTVGIIVVCSIFIANATFSIIEIEQSWCKEQQAQSPSLFYDCDQVLKRNELYGIEAQGRQKNE